MEMENTSVGQHNNKRNKHKMKFNKAGVKPDDTNGNSEVNDTIDEKIVYLEPHHYHLNFILPETDIESQTVSALINPVL